MSQRERLKTAIDENDFSYEEFDQLMTEPGIEWGPGYTMDYVDGLRHWPTDGLVCAMAAHLGVSFTWLQYGRPKKLNYVFLKKIHDEEWNKILGAEKFIELDTILRML